MCSGIKTRRGFTLIEVIISLTILAGIYVGVFSVVGGAARLFTAARAQTATLPQVEVALNSIAAALQHSISKVATGISSCYFTTDADTVEFVFIEGEKNLYMGPANERNLLLRNVSAFSITQSAPSGKAPVYTITLRLDIGGTEHEFSLVTGSRTHTGFGVPQKRAVL